MAPASGAPVSRTARVLAEASVCTAVALLIWMLAPQRSHHLEQNLLPRAAIYVEVARTADERAAGLSIRKMIGDGLLLEWHTAGRHPIWMADMQFAPDLVWVDGAGRVIAVLPNVPPCSKTPCPLYEPEGTDQARAVLELPAHSAGKYGLSWRADRKERRRVVA